MSICFINEQDDLKSRSIFRWLANLVDVRVIDSKSVCQFLLGFLDEVQRAKENRHFSKDLAVHCVLTFLTTEGASARLQKESAIDFGSILEIVNNLTK